MSLSDLPEEILALVVDYCKLKHRAALWEASGAMRAAMQHCGAGRLHLRTASDLRTLRSKNEALRRVLELVQVLNVRNTPLYKTAVMPIVRRMKNLRELDLSNTPTRLEHVVPVCGSLPRLTRLTIGVNNSNTPDRVFLSAAKSLQYLEYVHAIGLFDSLFCPESNLTLLQYASNLKELKLTVSVDNQSGDILERLSANRLILEGSYKAFSLHLINCSEYGRNFQRIIDKLWRDFNEWEFITVEKVSTDPKVMMSPKFLEAARRQGSRSVLPFSVKAPLTLECSDSLSIFAWHPELASINYQFHERIAKNILKNIPQHLCCANALQAEDKNSFIIHHCILNQEVDDSNSQLAQFIRSNQRINVTVKTDCHCPKDQIFTDKVPEILSLPRYVNLEFLNIANYFGTSTFDHNFFKNIFTNCLYLTTLNFENNDYLCVCETIKYSKSLRNLRIESGSINLKDLFYAMTDYKLLESVQICDNKDWPNVKLMISANSQLSVYEFIEVNTNLYNLQVYKTFIDSEDEYLFTESVKSSLRSRSLKLNFDVAEPPFPYDAFSRLFLDYHNLADCNPNKNIKIVTSVKN